jgi:triosephosphate isomerase
MRTRFIAGNWKMFKTVEEARHLVWELIPGLQAIQGVEKVLCPPFMALLPVAALLEGTGIGLGAQNMHWEASGAFTGEISPLMLAELCKYVILGHSERRTHFGETDLTVNRKLHAAFAYDLIPIVCVGETLAENEAGRTGEVISLQVREGLADLTHWVNEDGQSSLVIAYEPVWAIGTGRAATAANAVSVIVQVIRPALEELFGAGVAQATRVLYGGSVNGTNAAEFFKEPEIDGALVGGASLNVADFTQIVQAAVRLNF